MSMPENLKHSRYVTRLFDAVSRASGDGVRWVLQVTGADLVDTEPDVTLIRVANGVTTHVYGDCRRLRLTRTIGVAYDTLDRGRVHMRKDMALRRSKVQVKPVGDGRRAEILACIREYLAWFGRTPSHEELAQATGISRKTVAYHLTVLQQEGKIEIKHGRAYGIILKEGE